MTCTAQGVPANALHLECINKMVPDAGRSDDGRSLCVTGLKPPGLDRVVRE
jgi:hypothetical protein